MLPDTVADDERTSYFLHFRNQFKNGNVLFSAYFPPFDLRPCQLSVFRTDGLTESEIWDIGETHIASKGDAKIKARADLKARYFRMRNLTIEKDEPPLRHANVLGWPEPRPPFDGESRNDVARETWQEMTTELALNAKLEQKP